MVSDCQSRRAGDAHVGRRRHFSCWNIHNSAQRHSLKAPPGARRFPPAAGSASGGLFHRGVFTVGLSCPPSRPLVRLAGSVCNEVLPAGAYGSRSLLTSLLVPPRRASARDFSGQAPCPPGFGSDQGCFGRVRAPAVTGLRGKPRRLARGGGLSARACDRSGFGVVRQGFRPAPEAGRCRGAVGECFPSGALPANQKASQQRQTKVSPHRLWGVQRPTPR